MKLRARSRIRVVVGLGATLVTGTVLGALSPALGADTAQQTLPAPQVVERFRCAQWTFVPPITTRCDVGVRDTVRVILSGGRVLAYSGGVRRWVAIPYTLASNGRLEFDARKTTVPQPASGTPWRVPQYRCDEWRVSGAGATTCSRGRAITVSARFDGAGQPARLWDTRQGRYVSSAYRWNPAGGYLGLDARLVPAAAVSFGPTMTPTPSWVIRDYVVDCAGGSATATVTARAGGTVVLDGESRSSGSFSVPLSPGQAVRWTLDVPGLAPVTQQARCLPPDFPRHVTDRQGKPASEWYLLAPTLGPDSAGANGPHYVMVLDARGTPVWWRPITTVRPIDAKVLPSGDLVWAGAGYTFSQTAVYQTSTWSGVDGVSVGDGLNLDHHELEPSENGHYYALRYVYRQCPGVECVDMTAFGGSAAATILDSEIVEIDSTGAEVWTWRFRDHIPMSEWSDLDSANLRSLTRFDVDAQDYWDIHHANSIEDDGDGVIVSARHLNAVYRIRKSDGSIDWKLGGTPRRESLTVLALDRSPLFQSQHDARRLADGSITVFDNGSEDQRVPRALALTVDPVARTASVTAEVTDDRVPISVCCGGTRRLSGGGWVTAWGGTGWVTETDSAGKALISFNFGNVFTYRVEPIEPGTVSYSTIRAGMDAMNPRS